VSRRLAGLYRSAASRYAIIGMAVIILFGVGVVIGTLVNRVVAPSSDATSPDAGLPSGGAVVNPPHLLQDFTLTSHNGDPMRLSDLHGRAVLMFFGYTHCPDVCPTTLADYTRVKQALGSAADEVAFVFISVDGKRDTPDVLAAYLSRFDSSFIGLTGDEATLRQMGQEYGLFFENETVDDQNYFVQHTSPSFLVDRAGYLRRVYFYGARPDVIAAGIQQILE